MAFATPGSASGQTSRKNSGWNLISLDGSVTFIGQHREQESIFQNAADVRYRLSSLYTDVNATLKSYIWHPEFLRLDLDVGLNPGIRNDEFFRTPARVQARTAERLGARVSFLQRLPVSFRGNVGFNHVYTFRESINSVEGRTYTGGAVLAANLRNIPIDVTYRWMDWKEDEQESDRDFNNVRNTVTANAGFNNRAYGSHRLTLKHDDVRRERRLLYNIRQTIQEARLQNRFNWNKRGRNWIRSYVRLSRSRGTTDIDRTQVQESIRFDLPLRFSASSSYRYARSDFDTAFNSTNQVSGMLEHQLFQSLHSSVEFERTRTLETNVTENRRSVSASVDYTKQIPGGRLNVTWSKQLREQDQKADDGSIFVVDEEHEISDDVIVLLDNADVDRSTVVVQNASRTIIYEEGFDYLLLETGRFLELKRLRGGQILEGSKVLVDYVAGRLVYTYNASQNTFAVDVSTFRNVLRLYFRKEDLDYDELDESVVAVLKTIDRSVVGGELRFGFVTGGAETDVFHSNITPYRTERVYGSFSRSLWERVFVSLSGSYRRMNLTDVDEVRTYGNVLGMFRYRVGKIARIEIEAGYQKDRGPGIDLDLQRLGIEYGISGRRISLSAGVDLYNRRLIKDKLTFADLHVRFGRRF